MESFNINNTIDNLYSKNGFMELYGGQLYLSIGIIFVILVIFQYLQFLNNSINILQNWSHYKCDPLIMPLAGFINTKAAQSQNMTPWEFTYANFKSCMEKSIISVGTVLEDGAQDILSIIGDGLTDVGIIIGGLIKWAAAFISMLEQLISDIWNLLLNGVAGTQVVLDKAQDSLNKVVGFTVINIYVQILMFRMGVLWMLTTPIFLLFEQIVPYIMDIIFFCIANMLYTYAMLAAFIICGGLKLIAGNTLLGIGVNTAITGGVDDAVGAATETTGDIEEAAAPMCGFFYPLCAAVAWFTDVLGGTFLGIGSTLMAISGATSAASAASYAGALGVCGMNVLILLGRILLIIGVLMQIGFLILTLYLISILITFNDSVLGSMNIPGVGIPGLVG